MNEPEIRAGELTLKKDELCLKRKEYDLKVKEYDLKVDEQANKLLELIQAVMLLLVTGSLAITGFMFNYVLANEKTVLRSPDRYLLFGLGAASSLLAAILGLLCVMYIHQTFAINIKYLFAKKTNEDLTPEELGDWKSDNQSANHLRIATVALLPCGILFYVWLIIASFIQ